MTSYLRNARFIDWRDGSLHEGHLAVEPGAGGGCAPVTEIPAGVDSLDCQQRIVTRAFAVAHHHLYSGLARGMPQPAVAPTNFVEILERIWWNLDKQLDLDMVRACAQVGALECLKSGVTFVIDHHASPHAAKGSLHAIAEELDRIGVGHLLCYELSDRDGAACRDAGLVETADYLRSHQGLVGLHASFTVSDALLTQAVQLAEATDTGIHVHVAEDQADQDHCLSTHGMRVVQRLADHGALRAQSILAHCLHLDPAERATIAQSPAWVVQNTESNQNNGVGRFVAEGLGARLLVGTDGMHSDALRSARAAYLDGAMAPADALARLRAVHGYLTQGGFGGDGDNDLLVLDYDSPTPVTAANWPAHLMYGVDRRHVHSVLRQGRLVLDAGRVTTVDETEVLAFANQQAARLWRRL